MSELDGLIDLLGDALTDDRTWLADALRRGEGFKEVKALRDLCTEILDAKAEEEAQP